MGQRVVLGMGNLPTINGVVWTGWDIEAGVHSGDHLIQLPSLQVRKLEYKEAEETASGLFHAQFTNISSSWRCSWCQGYSREHTADKTKC